PPQYDASLLYAVYVIKNDIWKPVAINLPSDTVASAVQGYYTNMGNPSFKLKNWPFAQQQPDMQYTLYACAPCDPWQWEGDFVDAPAADAACRAVPSVNKCKTVPYLSPPPTEPCCPPILLPCPPRIISVGSTVPVVIPAACYDVCPTTCYPGCR